MFRTHEDITRRLDQLGLEGLVPGPASHEPDPTPDQGQGFARDARPSLSELAAHYTPVTLDCQAARRVGFQVRRFAEAPTVWEFYHASQDAPTLHPAPSDEALEREQALVRLDLSALPQDELVLVVESTGEGLLVRREGSSVSLWPLYPTRSLRVPLESWLEDSDDDELIDWIRQRVPNCLPERLVAAGMIARLEAPPSDESARERLLEIILSGDAPLDPQRLWAQRLEPDQVRALEALAHTAAAELRGRLDAAFEEAPALEDSSFEALCEARDDLECLRVLLLQHRQAGQALDEVLVALDRQGVALVDQLEEDFLVGGANMRMERVASQRPGVWWTDRFAWI